MEQVKNDNNKKKPETKRHSLKIDTDNKDSHIPFALTLILNCDLEVEDADPDVVIDKNHFTITLSHKVISYNKNLISKY